MWVSPKSQFQEVGIPEELSVNLTDSPSVVIVKLAMGLAMGYVFILHPHLHPLHPHPLLLPLLPHLLPLLPHLLPLLPLLPPSYPYPELVCSWWEFRSYQGHL